MAKKTSPLPPDQAQREAIVREVDTTMLVEAAAGTGKTTCLIGRMISLLAKGRCKIDTLAAVTFTRKAAAELRARFQVDLERQATQTSGDAHARLEAAADHVERCFIGTIHSFCARLLRERPVEAGVDVAFEEIDEAEDARRRAQAWQQFAAELHAGGDPLLDELANLGLDLRQLSDTFMRFADYPDIEEWPAPPVELSDLAETRKALRDYLRHMQRLAPSLPADAGTDPLTPKYRSLWRIARQYDLEQPAQLLEFLGPFKELKAIQKVWPGGKAQAKAEEARWNEFVRTHAEPVVAAWRAHRYPTVLKVLQKARERYDQLRADLGALNYQDLLMRAAALLRDRPNVRQYFRQRFTHVLVDEFQDTDPIQAEVLLLLTADDENESKWRACRPVPGSLFVVGDPKQSIYRFRRADIVTYNHVRDIIRKAGGKVVNLSANFRSVGAVVDWVNAVSPSLFPAEADDVSPADVQLQAAREQGCIGELAGVRHLAIPEEHTTKETIAAYEADFIARYIRGAIDGEKTIPRSRRELDRGLAPKATAGDFLIITRNTHRLSVYAKALQDLGIPHEVTGSAALNEVPALALLHTCLAAAVAPENPVALVAALRSPLFGVSDQTLYAFKKAGGRFSFRAQVPADLQADGRTALADAFERLRTYAGWLALLPPAAAIEKVSADLGLPALAAASPGGNVDAGSLAKAIELVRSAQAEQWSAAEAVAYLGQLVNQDEKYDGIPAKSHPEPAVRVMNLHKAKGLEGPLVFLADPSGESQHGVDLCVDRTGPKTQGYLAVSAGQQGWQRPPLLAHPRDWAELWAEEKRFQDAEAERLLYVAATRAGAQLVVSQRAKGNRWNPWSPFLDHLGGCELLSDPGPQSAQAPARSRLGDDELRAANEDRARRWNAVTQPTYGVAAVKAISVAGDAPRAGAGEHGTEWGAVIHTLLEAALRSPEADLRPVALSALASQDLDRSLADRALSVVSRVMSSDLWQRGQNAPRRFTEIPFQVLLPAAAGTPPTVLRGVIDLVFEEPDGWVVIDFKTDDRTGQDVAALVERYRQQLAAYAGAWTSVTGRPVAEAALFFVHSQRYVPVSVR